MSTMDYQRVEQELQQQIQPLTNFKSSSLNPGKGWSTAALGMLW